GVKRRIGPVRLLLLDSRNHVFPSTEKSGLWRASIIPIRHGGETETYVAALETPSPPVMRADSMLTRAPLSNMLLCPMKRPRTVARQGGVMSPSARPSLLSPNRQAIIRPAFERPREFVLLSVRAGAERLGTAPATMIRIVRGMQFASYREFRHYVHELSIAH